MNETQAFINGFLKAAFAQSMMPPLGSPNQQPGQMGQPQPAMQQPQMPQPGQMGQPQQPQGAPGMQQFMQLMQQYSRGTPSAPPPVPSNYIR